MNPRIAVALALVALVAIAAWRAPLYLIGRPGAGPAPLRAIAVDARTPAHFDAALPQVPIGIVRLQPGDAVRIIHFWAPWERESAAQVSALDSLRHLDEVSGLQVTVVCFDPFPSVSRYVARRRLRLSVVLDLRRELARDLPCPSIPYTYVIDRHGRIAVRQPGEVDWLGPETRSLLAGLLAEPVPVREVAPAAL